MDIVEQVKTLNFPSDRYIVAGSGLLAALGLRECHDVDIVVTPDLFEQCSREGWEKMAWTYPGREGEFYLTRGMVELYLDVNCGGFCPTLNELLQRAVLIGEVPFVSLEDAARFKREYYHASGNIKHIRDIALIETYLGKAHTDV